MWPVSTAALKANASERLRGLSRPKSAHPGYLQCKPVRIYHLLKIMKHVTMCACVCVCLQVVTIIPRAAFSARASRRLQQLAIHKTYLPLEIKEESEWDWGEWKSDICRSALHADPSPRVTELSLPKQTHKLYVPNKPTIWPVKKSALQHSASERQIKLGQPKQIPRYQEDYNPHRWTVSRAALMAQASPRLEELSKQLPRKCTTRK